MDANKIKNLPLWTLALWLVILACWLLMGCRTKSVTEYVEVHDTMRIHHTDTLTLYKTKAVHDTLRQEVERVVTLRESGETLRVTLYRDRWRTVTRTDTIDRYRAKFDSLQAIVDKTHDKTIVKQPRLGWKLCGAVLLAGIILAIIIRLKKTKI